MRTMHIAPVTAALFLAGGVGCNPDIGEPVETVIIQDSGVIAEAAAPGTLGATCTKNGDCKSTLCLIGNKSSYCSLACTAANAMTACATAPFNGTCNMQGFCRLP